MPLDFRPVALALILFGASPSCVSTDASSGSKAELGKPVNAPAPIWSDEFDGSGPVDFTKWSHELGGWGWGNNELQNYTASIDNSRREDGVLIVEARREPSDTMAYSSARLVTRGKHDFTYGRVAARAKLPRGLGTWPAIWMLGSNIGEVGWPTCGEIDIMEHVGFAQDTLYSTAHTEAYNHKIGTQKTDTIAVPGVSDEFHVYAIDWREDHISAFVDDSLYFTYEKPENATEAQWPFDKPEYLILNLAVGGDWGGLHGVDTTIWPQAMEVDWVRVWE